MAAARVEGLTGPAGTDGSTARRFAMYIRAHHALMDGFTGMRLFAKALSKDPSDENTRAPWTVGPSGRRGSRPAEKRGRLDSLRRGQGRGGPRQGHR